MSTFEAYLEQCRDRIRTYGFVIQQAGSNGWAYTIGLSSTLGYELACVGLPPEVTFPVINNLAAFLRGKDVPDDQPIAEVANQPVVLRTISLNEEPEIGVLLGVARALEMVPSNLRQMFWPDPSGHFPGSAEYSFPNTQDLRAIAAEEVRVRRAMASRSKKLH